MNRKYNFEFLFIFIWNHYRRIAHGRGSLSSHRTRRHNNPASSSSGPPASGQPGSGLSALSTLSPSARDAVDPIAELLSQLSGVRRGSWVIIITTTAAADGITGAEATAETDTG